MNKRTWIFTSLALILTAYQIVRLIVFANVYGGIEPDSGWFASVSRSLAERGTYTTMTSTIVDPTVAAAVNVHDHFDVQDEEGRIWFFTVNSVGPSSIVPYAIILKIFGPSFWSLKAGPLLFCAVFLLLASFLLYRVGGIAPLLLFHLFPIFYPHLLVYLGYEAFGEVPTMVYILLTYLLFIKATQSQSHQTTWFLLCGLLAGLALLTKVIALFSISSLFVLWFLLFRQHKVALKHLVIMGVGLIILPLLWEIVQFITVAQIANFEIARLHAAERLSFTFQTDAVSSFIYESGAGDSQIQIDVPEFILAKLLTVSVISHPSPIISLMVLAIVAVSGPLLAYLRRNEAAARNIILLIWVGWLVNTIWFVGLSKMARVRRDWIALIFAIMLFCWLVGYFLQRAKSRPTWQTISIAGILTAILLVSFFSQWHAVGFFIPDSLVETWRLNYLSNDTLVGKYEQQVPWIIIPKAQQDEVVDYLTQLPRTSQIFYVDKLKVSELSVVVGRVFYPFERRRSMTHSDEDVVVIGGLHAFSPWRRPQSLVEPIKQEIKRQCPEILLENDYYIICAVTN